MAKKVVLYAILNGLLLLPSLRINAEEVLLRTSDEMGIFVGKRLKEYPESVLVEEVGNYNIFWSNSKSCFERASDDYVVDQERVLWAEKVIRKTLSRVDKTLKVLSEKSLAFSQLYHPERFRFSVFLDLGSDYLCSGVNRGRYGVDQENVMQFTKEGNSFHIQIGANNPKNMEESDLEKVITHEFAHGLFYHLNGQEFTGGGSIFRNLLNETFSDFFTLISYPQEPYIGKIYNSSPVDMSRYSIEEKNRAKIIKSLGSQNYSRDFRNELNFNKAYLYPNRYVFSVYFNHFVYKLLAFTDPQVLLETFINMFLDQNSSVFGVDLYEFTKEFKNKLKQLVPNKKNQIERTWDSLNWRSPKAKNISIKTNIYQLDEDIIGIELVYPKSDKSFSTKNKIVSFSFDVNLKTVFSMQHWIKTFEPILAMQKVESCSSSDCFCPTPQDSLSITSLYLNETNELVKASFQDLYSFKDRSCYLFFPVSKENDLWLNRKANQ